MPTGYPPLWYLSMPTREKTKATCMCKWTRQLPTCWEFFRCLQVAKSLTSFKLNNTQKHATTFNRVCKQTQHVTSNTVSSCLPTMLGQSSHGLILHFQNDQSGQPVLTFGEWSPLKSDQDHFLSCHFYHFPLYLTSCKPPLPWLVVFTFWVVTYWRFTCTFHPW